MRPSATRRHRGEIGFVLGVLFGFGCNGVGCDGCGGAQRSYPTVPVTLDGGLAPSDGGVRVGGIFDICPDVTIEVMPTSPRVNQTVTVRSRATDADSDGGLLTYEWTATAGSFVAPMAHDTTYNCGPAGPVTITLTVSDGLCPVSKSTAIFCVALSDGGLPSGTGGATGAGGSGAGGNGAGGAGGGIPNTCPTAEPTSGGPMCPQCTTDNCTLGPTGTDGCCGLASVVDQQLCEAAVACFTANTATCTAVGDPTNCFCGTSGGATGTCFAVKGAANGPCVAQVIAAAKTDDPATIQTRFISPMFPIGRAVNLVTCRGGLCSAECGIN